MSTEPDKRDFDFRRLLPDRRSPYVTSRVFSPIDSMHADPDHARRVWAARHYLSNATMPGEEQAWDRNLRALVQRAKQNDSQALAMLDRYDEALQAVVLGFVRGYESSHLAEKETALEHYYVAGMWRQLNNRLQYFRAAHPELVKTYGIPDYDTFEAALPHLFDEAQEHIECPEPEAPTPRAVTPLGERVRAAVSSGMSREDAQTWAERDLARRAAVRHDPAQQARSRMMRVIDPISGISWYKAFSNAAVAQEARLNTDHDPSAERRITELHHAWHRLDNSLVIYSELLRHNYLHPDQRQATDQSFAQLVASVEQLLGMLPQAQAALPSVRQFSKLRLPMHAAATEALEEERSATARHGHSRNGGGPGYPLGGRR